MKHTYTIQDIQDLRTCFSFLNCTPQSCFPKVFVFYRFIYIHSKTTGLVKSKLFMSCLSNVTFQRLTISVPVQAHGEHLMGRNFLPEPHCCQMWQRSGREHPGSLLPDTGGSSVWMFSSDNGRKVVSCGSFK